MSDRKLTAAEEAILQKGPEYAPTPRTNPIDFAAPIESALSYSKVSDQVKETTRIIICEVLWKAKRPQSNVSKEESQAWRTLQEDTTIKILKADKGNATVVMNTSQYDEKVHELLDDKNAYTPLKNYPLHQMKEVYLQN